ncbi:MAG: sulfatase [Phycisphaerae bacterium]|nr:sulfatase [Phycisphaerae bacterium]
MDSSAPNNKTTWLRRRWSVTVVVVIAAAHAGMFGLYWYVAHPTYDGPVRHVIFVSMDTTRRDHFGCYGNQWIRTPRIDALAAESIVFTDYMTVVPTTLASHTSLFTGKYPHTHGTPRNGFTVNQENVMLPEVLKRAGFHNIGFIASFALDSRFGFSQGFDHYDETFDRLVTRPDDLEYQDQRSAQSVTDTVIRYLDQTGIPADLFLFVHYFDPHTYYAPPAPYDTLYQRPEAMSAAPPDLTAARDELARTEGKATPAAETLAARYAGEVSYMDEHIGRLLDYLEARGILDESILIVTSDHGENFWEHPSYFNHGLTTYQTTMSAVCMIRMPGGVQGGTRVDEAAASIDVLPTVLKHLGLPVPAGVEGKALDLTGTGVASTPRVRFGQATKLWDGNTVRDTRSRSLLEARCAVQGDLKYIQTPYVHTEELYDLSVDPHERNNLLIAPTSENAARAAELRERLDEWVQSADPLPSQFDRSQLDDTIRRLRSLGYAGP